MNPSDPSELPLELQTASSMDVLPGLSAERPLPTDDADATSPLSESERHLLDLLADEYSSRLRSGELPPIEEFIRRAPEHESAIRNLFPTIAVIEQMSQHEHLARRSRRRILTNREVIGDFRIIREVGRGGMGVVYEAEQCSLQRRVALKVLGTGISESPRQLERFRREAESVAKLHHTNIVQVYGNGEDDGTHFYAMQFVDGITLCDAIAVQQRAKKRSVEAPPPSTMAPTPKTVIKPIDQKENESHVLSGDMTRWPQQENPPRLSSESEQIVSDLFSRFNSARFFRKVARLGQQVADALHYAHQHGVMHRDIKPSNLMLDGSGTVWVMDFGLVKTTESQDITRTGEIVGTIRYMAPEQLTGHVDHTTDIYSLGLTLYELLTLKPAFEGDSTVTFSRRLKGCDVPRLSESNPSIPRDLETIILKATAREPSSRYATAAAFAEDLRRFCEDRPILARRSTIRERLWRWSRRNPALAVAICTTIALLGLIDAIATHGRFKVEAALKEAKAAQLQAEANIDLAINAFGSILDNVKSRGLPRSLSSGISESEADLMQTPLSHADAVLLDRLLVFYRDFARQSEGNSQRNIRIADAHYRAGAILVRLGRLQEAKDDFHAAIGLLDKTPKSDPNYVSSIVKSAAINNELGELHLRRGEFRETSDSHLEARALLLELPAEARSLPNVRFELARSTDLFASIDVRSGSNEGPGSPPPGPPPNGRKADRRRGDLFPEEPWSPHDHGPPNGPPPNGPPPDGPPPNGPPPDGGGHRGFSWGQRGDHKRMERLMAAEPEAMKRRNAGPNHGLSVVLLEACSEFRSLANEFPQNTQYKFHLAQCLRHRLVHAATVGQDHVAQEAFREAVDILNTLAQTHPDDPRFLFELADTLTQAARGQSIDESKVSLDRAVATAKELSERFPSVSEYQLLLGTALARRAAVQQSSSIEESRDSLTQSLRILDELAQKFPDQGIIQIPLARTSQQMGDLLRTSAAGSPDPAAQLMESQRLLRAAIERFGGYLKQSVKQGNFNTSTLSNLHLSLADTLQQQGMSEEAETERQMGFEVRRPGPPHRQ